MKRAIYLMMVVLGLGSFVIGASTASATGNPNDASYWQQPNTRCYKHTSLSEHADVTNNGKAVTLKTFNQSWFGDHWALLVVKGGEGRTVYTLPSAGTAYYPPKNNGGQKPDVSHYIVCKGETWPTTTTSSSSSTSSTTTTTTSTPSTTTVPSSSSTTEPSTTSSTSSSTTIPTQTTDTSTSTTTSTVPPTSTPTTTPGSSTSTSSTAVPTSSVPPSFDVTSTSVPPTGPTTLITEPRPPTTPGLPSTGSATDSMILMGLGAVLGGVGIAGLARRDRRNSMVIR